MVFMLALMVSSWGALGESSTAKSERTELLRHGQALEEINAARQDRVSDDRLRFGIAILRVRVRFDPFPDVSGPIRLR